MSQCNHPLVYHFQLDPVSKWGKKAIMEVLFESLSVEVECVTSVCLLLRRTEHMITHTSKRIGMCGLCQVKIQL
jgi:hypothetical protein